MIPRMIKFCVISKPSLYQGLEYNVYVDISICVFMILFISRLGTNKLDMNGKVVLHGISVGNL